MKNYTPTIHAYMTGRSPEGQRNAELFKAAQQAFWNKWTLAEAMEDLAPKAARDGLGQGEIASTIESAFANSKQGEPSAGKHSPSDNGRISRFGFKVNFMDIEKKGFYIEPELPSPIEDGWRKLLEVAFKPGEKVRVVRGRWDEERRKDIPEGKGSPWPLETLMDKNPSESFPQSDPRCGLFVGLNPTTGSTDSDVTAFRHALLEWDDVPKPKQYKMIIESQLPVTAIVNSGGKSVHAWVRVDAPNKTEFKRRVETLHEFFEKKLDTQCSNPGRLGRAADYCRGDGHQSLLATNVGMATWEEWEAWAKQPRLPDIISGADLLRDTTPLPNEIIKGLLYKGSKMVIGGSSKSRKTWTLLDMAVALQQGMQWWGHECEQANTLFINFELHSQMFRERMKSIVLNRIKRQPSIKHVMEELGQRAFPDIWNLRGHATSFDILIPQLIKQLKEKRYDAIIIDPVYKGLGSRSENDAGDMNQLMNEIESLAQAQGSAVIFSAHFSKGNQAAKDAIDRISGSGVFARDPDTIMVMTQHAEQDCYTIDSICRYFESPEPYVVGFDFPLFSRRDDLSPDDLKTIEPHNKGQAEKNAQQLLSLIKPGELLSWSEFRERFEGSKATFAKYLKLLVHDGDISHDGKFYKLA
jgi:RecA-family ATPase